MSKINNKNKKRLAVLSSAALGVLIASAVTTSVSAKVTSYIVNDNGKIISFASDDLIADYTNKLLGKASPMFDAYLEKASGLTAFQDSIKGYVSYESVYEAYLDALLIHEGNNFNIDSVTENAGAEDIKDITVGYEWKDGAVTPVDQSKVITSVDTITVPATTVGTVPTLPTTVNVTLGDGTTKAANITWNEAATSADTYATAGTVTINGTLADYDNYAVSASVTVNPAELAVSSVSAINATADSTITVGSSTDSTLALKATVVDQNNNAATATVTWTSSDNTVATVDANGVVTAVKAGTATISATVGTSVKTYTVTVLDQQAPTISSVTTLNRNQVVVQFNKPLDTTVGANTTAANYLVNNLALTGGDAVAFDPTDASKVIITFDKAAGAGVLAAAASGTQLKVADAGYLDNDTTYAIKVASNTLVAKDGTKLFPNASDVPVVSVTFSDHAKPQVTSASFDQGGNLVLKFNEPVYVPTSLANKITYNSQYATITTPAAAETLITQINSKTVVVSQATLTAITPALQAGSTYPLVVSGIKDLAGNLMDTYTANLPYTASAVAPAVTSVTAKDEGTIVVTMNAPLSGVLVDGTTLNVYKGSTKLTLGAITDVSAAAGLPANSKFEIALPVGADVVYNSALSETSATLNVNVKNAKDAYNNTMTEYNGTVVVTKDTTKPAFVSAAYTAANTATVTSSKVLATTAPADTAANYAKILVTDSDGVAYPVTAITPSAAGAKTFSFTCGGGLTAGKTYHAKLAAGLFNDNTLNGGNYNAAVEFDFTAATADTTAPEVVSILSSSDNTNVIAVTYNEAMTTGIATGSISDLANYSYNGTAIPAGSTITVNPGKTVATITFAPGTISTTQALTFTVAGSVKDAAGNLINTNPAAPDVSTTAIVQITDNVKPALQSAVVNSVNGNLELTFSEKVNGTQATADSATAGYKLTNDQIQVYKDGVLLGTGTIVAGSTLSSTDNKVVFLTPAGGDSFLTGNITVKIVTGTNTGADGAANKLTTNTVVTATRK